MTDLLLSELLVLVLLLPVLLRPFSKLLKKGYAIPILPFIALFVCICIIIGQGIILPFFILLTFTLLVCISEIIRLTAFSQGVLNDFYGTPSIMLRLVLLVLFGGTVYLCFRFAPEPRYKPEHPLIIRPIALAEEPANPVQGFLIERKNGADKKMLAVVAESFPADGQAGTTALMLADKGYTVLDITRLEHRYLPRFALYQALLRTAGKKERFLPKEKNPQTAEFFQTFIKKTVRLYGQHKRLFFYTEGIYTDLTAAFCADNAGLFTGVFFNLSEDEPLPAAPDGWAALIRREAEDEAAAALDNGTHPRPFCFYIQPRQELAGFGSLRADDSAAAELLGSGRSIGRRDKAAAAAAFDRYALSF
ncbi:MAG: hypothetical protein P1P65_05945 [Treponema sp.]